MQGYTELGLGPLDRLRLSVAAHQGATLLSIVADALGGRAQGLPEHWRRLVRRTAPPGADAVLAPLFDPAYSVIPDCLTPTALMPDGDVPGQCAHLAELAPDILLGELEAEFPDFVPPQWQPVVDRPGQWLRSYAQVLERVWEEFAPVWRRAAPLLGRETERVGVAAVTGNVDVLLGSVSPRFRYAQERLLLPDQQAAGFALDDRRLLLVPIVSGPGASMFALDRPDLVWIGYPVPGIGHLWEDGDRVPPGTDALQLLLGPRRAEVLRGCGQPLAMGDLATRIGCSPGTLTYHCAQLEQAGLLRRERRGQQVMLSRTDRGDALLDLLI
ncbi:helix-turn-helix transcriptional regulator [Streptomyces sp. NA04227]|uniref:ArsR/SmtB family transcription factor n=1 Tax=Streptomyces sp. NA04227 TaxID=2742136 RepID=UPI001592486D|nr:helix-turn-helix domain-containing protein [Streptomyces sp. NA04227]QKW05123.1 helix-turn-helix transcriptional regulator [Streptomyces sp. NA04227]